MAQIYFLDVEYQTDLFMQKERLHFAELSDQQSFAAAAPLAGVKVTGRGVLTVYSAAGAARQVMSERSAQAAIAMGAVMNAIGKPE